MSRIAVPVDVHLITLLVRVSRVVTREVRVGNSVQRRRRRVQSEQEIPSRWTGETVRTALKGANAIWAQADIDFNIRFVRDHTIEAPGNREDVNANGYQYLINQYPARNGISLLLVFRFERQSLGGQASRGVCILPFLTSSLRARVLAHEFAHCLALGHMEEEGTHLQNLMRPGLVSGGRLTENQISTARESRLAVQVSRAQSPTQSP